MSDQEADKYAAAFLPTIMARLEPESISRTLRLLVKEVERDTRHLAYDVVQGALQEISNLDHAKGVKP